METENHKKGKFFGFVYTIKRRNWIRVLIPSITICLSAMCFILFLQLKSNIEKLTDIFSVALNLYTMVLLSVLNFIVYFDETPPLESDGYFYTLSLSIFFGALADAVSIITDGNADYFVLCSIMSYVSCLATPCMCTAFYFYQDSMNRKKLKKRKLILTVISILFFIDVLYILSNIFFKHLFYFENYYYVSGKYVSSLFTFPLLLVVSYIFLFFSFDMPKKNRNISSVFFLILPMITGIFWTITKIEMVYIGATIAYVILYGLIHLDRSVETAKNKEALVRKEQEIMLSQINPHFLYNTLSTIKYLCEEDTQLAMDTVDKFARYLRINVDTLGHIDVVPFSKELQHVQNYLEIEHLRFDYIDIVYDINETDFQLPVLTVQPIVENAIKYGARANKNGIVKISSYKENGWYVVSVYDNGMGFDIDKVFNREGDDRSHCGIALVRDRLRYICNGVLEIKSMINEGTLVNIKIPCEVKQ